MSGERGNNGGRLAGLLAVGVAAAIFAGTLPAAASAADYCVAPNTTCGGTNVATFEQALDLADNATDADRIFLGAATYTAPTASGYLYNKPDSPVEIVGQGEGQTILTGQSGGNNAVLKLFGGAGSSVHDLTIRLPQNAAGGLSGLWTSNMARGIEVVEDPTQANYRYGVDLEGGTLEDSSVTIDNAQDTTAAFLESGGGTVRRSALSASTGVWSNYGGAIERSRVTGSEYGVRTFRNVLAIASSVIRFTAGGGEGIVAQTQSGYDNTVNAEGVTIVGPGLPSTYGAVASTVVAQAQSADINLSNSIIRGVSKALYASAPGSGQGKIAASYSDYDPSGNTITGANASISQANVSNVVDVGFVDTAGGDYHLRPGSPLVDAGDPATPQGLDLDGDPLVADGNGDGIARRDMGAFELPPAPASGDGQPPASGGTAGAVAPADIQPPLVSGFKAEPALFAVATKGTPLAARVPLGTRFRYTLSEAAQVRLTIQRALAGRRKGSSCVRPTPALRHAKPCTRYRTVGTLARSGAKGSNTIRFSGRIGRRALLAGRYRAIIRASDAAGNRSAPRSVRFRIVAG